MAANPVQYRRTKHIKIDIHFIREKVALGKVHVLHVPTSAQFADIFTKGLPTTSFTDIRSSLNIVSPDVDTARGILEYITATLCLVRSLDCNIILSLLGFLSLKSCTLYK
jgi:hypothetical protein